MASGRVPKTMAIFFNFGSVLLLPSRKLFGFVALLFCIYAVGYPHRDKYDLKLPTTACSYCEISRC